MVVLLPFATFETLKETVFSTKIKYAALGQSSSTNYLLAISFAQTAIFIATALVLAMRRVKKTELSQLFKNQKGCFGSFTSHKGPLSPGKVLNSSISES